MVSYRLYTPDNAVGTKFDGEIYFLFDLLFNQINFRLEHAVTRCHGLTKLNWGVRSARLARVVLDRLSRERSCRKTLARRQHLRRTWIGRIGPGTPPSIRWRGRWTGSRTGKVSPPERDLRHTMGRRLTVV